MAGLYTVLLLVAVVSADDSCIENRISQGFLQMTDRLDGMTNAIQGVTNAIQAVVAALEQNQKDMVRTPSSCCSPCPRNTPADRFVDCKYLYDQGHTTDGVYTINPADTGPFDAYCDMTNGGWTVFQRRIDDTVDFYRGWDEYVAGFGDLSGNLWAGLDNLHAMASAYDTELHVYMDTFENEHAEAMYSAFSVGDAQSKYKLSVSGYSGTAGDGLLSHSAGMPFSTHDADNDRHSDNCADTYKGAWWYGRCHASNLNGLYLAGAHSSFANGVNWKAFKGYYYSLKTTIMKLRRI